MLENVSSHIFAAGFGMFLICYSSYMILRPALAVSGGCLAEVAAGFAGGITGGATAFPGAFPTIWCSLRGLSKNEQRGIVQPFILLMQIATLVYFSKLGTLASGTWTNYFWCVPAVIGGTWLGLGCLIASMTRSFAGSCCFFFWFPAPRCWSDVCGPLKTKNGSVIRAGGRRAEAI